MPSLKGRNPDSVRQESEIAKLGLAFFVSGGLNGGKFLLLPLVLGAHTLDVVAIGLLLAMTLPQIPGEALANHHVIARDPRARRVRRALLVSMILALVFPVVAPQATVDVLAPGFELSARDELAMRFFAAAGAAWILQWLHAGRQQADGNLSGLRVAALAPNVGLLLGLAVCGGNVALLAAVLACTLGVLAAAGPRLSGAGRSVLMQEPGVLPRVGIAALLTAGLAAQTNLLLVRVAAGDLPTGSLGGLYIAIGIVLLPVMASAGAATAVWLPLWVTGEREGATPGWRSVARGAWVSALIAVPLLALVLWVLDLSTSAGLVDRSVSHVVSSAIPWLAPGVPIAATAWMVRGWLLATGRPWPYVVSALGGSMLVLAVPAITPSVDAVAVGFMLSPLPTILTAVWVARGRREGRQSAGDLAANAG